MDSDLYFGKIEIVEWLGEGDAKTGRELHHFIADLLPQGLPEVDLELRRASTKDEFLTCLDGVAQSVRHSGLIPLLHIETHGNPHGIGPPGQEPLSWPELAPALVAINQLTQLRLFVFLAACEGIWAMKMVVPTQRAPVFGILGPNRDITAGQLADACKAFYSAMARTRSATAAIAEMNAAVSQDRIFSVAGAELLFTEVWKYYLEDPSLSKDVAERVKHIVRNVLILYRQEHGVPMPTEVEERVRLEATRHVEDHEAHFAEMQRHFFFMDLFPENARRFAINLNALASERP